MRVVDVTIEWEEAYERFVSAHAYALLYYSLRFRDFLVSLLRCSPRYAAAVEGTEIIGVLPLMVADGARGQILNSLPYFGSNGGILATDEHAVIVLSEWYRAEVAGHDVAAATVVANPLDPSPPELVHDLVDRRVGHITWLGGASGEGGGDLWQVIDGSARRNVRKATQAGVEVSVENHAFGELEALHRASMAAAGGVVKATSFFECVAKHFRDDQDYKIYIGRLNGEAVTALLLFYYGTTVEYYVPAVSPEYRPLQPTAAVLFQAMSDAKNDGYTRWNWGGSWVGQESLIRFKSKWGGRPHPYRYLTKLNRIELRNATSEQLLAEYPGFYILPFSELRDPDG